MRGRKPKPTKLKELEGNPGRRALPTDEPQTVPGLPPCPEFLDEDAKSVWQVTGKYLADAGILGQQDALSFAFYCIVVTMAVEAYQRIKAEGALLNPPSENLDQMMLGEGAKRREVDPGRKQRNPQLEILNKCIEQILKFSAEFGLTPSSRSRIHAGELPKEDELEKFLEEATAGGAPRVQ